jgi:uncharacterized protein
MSALPKLIDPILLAEKGKEISGQIPLSICHRLNESLHSHDGFATFKLEFGKDGRLPTIKGRIEANVVLQCHVCLEALDWRIDSSVNLGVVSSIDEADRLSQSYEPLVISNRETLTELCDIVQDELILALPIFPRHPRCSGDGSNDQVCSEKKPNPFSVLANLKHSVN